MVIMPSLFFFKKKKTTQQQNLSSQDSFYPIEPLLAENMSLYSCLLDTHKKNTTLIIYLFIFTNKNFKLFSILIRKSRRQQSGVWTEFF